MTDSLKPFERQRACGMITMSKKPALFNFKPFSKKQVKVLNWWIDTSPHKDKDGIICDGAIRAGKTVVMSLSFVIWAMENFDDENFGMAGKTIGSFRRNVVRPLDRKSTRLNSSHVAIS